MMERFIGVIDSAIEECAGSVKYAGILKDVMLLLLELEAKEHLDVLLVHEILLVIKQFPELFFYTTLEDPFTVPFLKLALSCEDLQ
jgi:hypothetical protein